MVCGKIYVFSFFPEYALIFHIKIYKGIFVHTEVFCILKNGGNLKNYSVVFVAFIASFVDKKSIWLISISFWIYQKDISEINQMNDR